MSKEKLSAEEWSRVFVQVSDEDGKIPWDELDSVNTSEVFKLMEAYAQYKTEQLQSKKVRLNLTNPIQKMIDFLTPKPEK